MRIYIDWNAPSTESTFETDGEEMEDILHAILWNLKENSDHPLVVDDQAKVIVSRNTTNFSRTTDRRDWDNNRTLSFGRSRWKADSKFYLPLRELFESEGWIILNTDEIRQAAPKPPKTECDYTSICECDQCAGPYRP